MGNKKNFMNKRTLGTSSKSRSKGTGHMINLKILSSDWLKIEKRLLSIFMAQVTFIGVFKRSEYVARGHFSQFSTKITFYDLKKYIKSCFWPKKRNKLMKMSVQRVNKYVKPLMSTLTGT